MDDDDYRDLVIRDAAVDLVTAGERMVSLETDVAVSREILVAALDALHDLTQQHHHKCVQYDQLHHEHQRLLEEMALAREDVHDPCAGTEDEVVTDEPDVDLYEALP